MLHDSMSHADPREFKLRREVCLHPSRMGKSQYGKQPIQVSVALTVLADSGTRYQSKLFNPAFLKEKGLPRPAWL